MILTLPPSGEADTAPRNTPVKVLAGPLGFLALFSRDKDDFITAMVFRLLSCVSGYEFPSSPHFFDYFQREEDVFSIGNFGGLF